MNLRYIYCLLFFLYALQVWPQFPRSTRSYGDTVSYFDFGFGYSSDGPELYYGMTNYIFGRGDGLPSRGVYFVRNSVTLPEFNEPIRDISGGYGYMLLVDSGNSSSDYFFKNTITGLCPGVTYEISAMIRSLLKIEGDIASLKDDTGNVFISVEDIDGNVLKSFVVGIDPLDYSYWRRRTFDFTPQGISTVVIRMKNFSREPGQANPIAVDDIFVRAVDNLVYADINNSELSYADVCINSVNSKIVLTASYKLETGLPKSSYQWQVSSEENNFVWTDIPGANRSQYSYFPNTVGYYNFRVGNADATNINSSSCRVYSDQVTANVMLGPVSPVVQVTQPSCDVPTGTITITEPRGLLYSIDGENYQPEMVFSNLSGGDYTVSVKGGECTSITENVRVNYEATTGVFPTVIVDQPLSCANPYGTITVTSLDAEYSFDNGQNWQSSNLITGLLPGEYLVKTRNSRFCQSLSLRVNITIPDDFPPTPSVIVTQPDCSNRMGSIEILNEANFYSFDGGITESISNRKNNLAPGTYQVLIKNNLGCLSFIPKEVVILPYVSTEPLPLVVSTSQSFCVQDNKTLNDVVISGTNIKWYDAPISGNLLSGTTILTNRTYYASQTVSICESDRIPVIVTVYSTPAPTGNTVQNFCATQNATIGDLEATGTAIVWYDLDSNGSVLDSSIPLADGQKYYASQTLNGCESVTRLEVEVMITTPTIVVNDVAYSFCDDANDGVELVDLTSYNQAITTDTTVQIRFYPTLADAQSQNNSAEIVEVTSYSIPTGITTVYARVDSDDKCYQVVKVVLTLFSQPIVLIGDEVMLCENSNVVIDAGSGFDSYLWSTSETTQSIEVSNVGKYSVTVTKNNGTITCTSTKDFEVILSNAAVISSIDVTDWTDNQNTITVNLDASSKGDYEYSVDGYTYQDSNVFNGLLSGTYTVYVRDKKGCGEVTQVVYILNYPKFFTPNGDGYNDTWAVKLSETEPNLKTRIFDRYGKFLKELTSTGTWDGTYAGHLLPSDDYWFVVFREDNKIYKGHFAIKR